MSDTRPTRTTDVRRAAGRTCGGCAHYDSVSEIHRLGVCRRMPPTVVLSVMIGDGFDREHETGWPMADADDDWCGEFSPKEEE